MVDAEHERPGGFGRRTEVHRGLPTPRADLDERGAGRPFASRSAGGAEQRRSLVLGHEALGGPGVGEESLRALVHLAPLVRVACGLVVGGHPVAACTAVKIANPARIAPATFRMVAKGSTRSRTRPPITPSAITLTRAVAEPTKTDHGSW